MKIDFDLPAGDDVMISAKQGDGQQVTKRAAKWGVAHDVATVKAGRISVVDTPMPSIGPTTLRPDGRYTLDLLDQSAARASVENIDGRVVEVTVDRRWQRRGWDTGEHYMLPVDADNNLIIYPGQKHRKVYITNGPHGLTRAAIAAQAGVTEATANGTWIASRSYGTTPESALSYDVGVMVYNAFYGNISEPRSDWFFFERGYSYLHPIVGQHSSGEDELHPIVFGAYGEGAPPIFTSAYKMHSYGPSNLVMKDLRFTVSFVGRYGYCNLYDSLWMMGQLESSIEDTSYPTVRRMRFKDNYRLAPTVSDTGEPTGTIDGQFWAPHPNRYQGLYSSACLNFLVDGVFADHAGWGEGFDQNINISHPQPPSMYSHNVYFAHSTYGVTLRNSLLMRGASYGMQVRASGHEMWNLFLNNNIPFNAIGGNYESRGYVGAYNLGLGNVIYSAGYKIVKDQVDSAGKGVASHNGSINWGLDDTSMDGALVGNIVCHRANPDDPAEIALKTSSSWAVARKEQKIYNDTKVFRWTPVDENIEGLDPAVLMQTTAHRYAAERLGVPTATYDDLAALFMDPATDIGAETQLMVNWFLTRYGFDEHVMDRTETANLVFLPDWRGEGFRWDNPLNWSTGDLPGMNPADTVDIGGGRATSGSLTSRLASLKTGASGMLEVAAGMIHADIVDGPSNFKVRRAGQLVIGVSTNPVTVESRGGMVRFIDEVSNAQIYAGGSAMVLFGDSAEVENLTLSGDLVRAGWDGTGIASLTLTGTLTIKAGILINAHESNTQKLMPGMPLAGTGWSGIVGRHKINTKYSQDSCRIWLYDVVGLPIYETVTFATEEINYMNDGAADPHNPTMSIVNFSGQMGGIVSAGMPKIAPFRSGVFGVVDPTVSAAVSLDCDLHLDLTGIGVGSYPLIEAASVTGTFGKVTVSNLAAGLTHRVDITATGAVLVVSSAA